METVADPVENIMREKIVFQGNQILFVARDRAVGKIGVQSQVGVDNPGEIDVSVERQRMLRRTAKRIGRGRDFGIVFIDVAIALAIRN